MFFVVFLNELIREAILSQNHWRSQGVAEGTRAPFIKMSPMTKFVKKALFLHFQFFLASLRTSVQAYSSN